MINYIYHYCSDVVKDYFENVIWVEVHEEYSMLNIFREMAANLKIESPYEKGLNELGRRIWQSLGTGPYLVVLDNVWEERVWKDISNILPDQNNGSRVIITTRFRNIAKTADRKYYIYPPHNLEPLNLEQSLELFLRHAVSQNDQCRLDDDFINLANEFAAKCNGLPLALQVLGSVVHKGEFCVHAWGRLLKTMTWPTDGIDCTNVLSTSYRCLPPAKRSCFLYLAMFPKNWTEIEAEVVYRLWDAEGLIPTEERRTPEETASCILEDLAQRRLVEVIGKFPDGSIWLVRVHDVLLEFLVREAQEHDFIKVCSKPADWEQCSNASRLAIHCSSDLTGSIDNYVSPDLCTLLIFGGSDSYQYSYQLKLDCSRFTKLRVLGCMQLGIVEMQNFSGAPSLRYLRLGIDFREQGDYEFGEWVSGMEHLQTLDLRNSGHGDLSEWIWKAKKLRHVFLNYDALSEGPPESSEPSDLQSMTRVRWNRSWGPGSFPNLPSVRELDIEIGAEIPLSEVLEFLAGLKNLVDLRIDGDVRVLQTIDWRVFPFYDSLKYLSLSNNKVEYGDDGLLPCLLHLADDRLPCSLVRLYLYVNGLASDAMAVLEKLRRLRSLTLFGSGRENANELINGVRRIRCSSGGFKQLEELNLLCLPLEEWEIELGAMPVLIRLIVDCCDPLKVPTGLIHLDSVQLMEWRTNEGSNHEAIDNIVAQHPHRRHKWKWWV